jgi:hypothetical protein
MIVSQFEFAQKYFNATPPFKLSYDNSGKRYKEVIDKICNGKCSENYRPACPFTSGVF